MTLLIRTKDELVDDEHVEDDAPATPSMVWALLFAAALAALGWLAWPSIDDVFVDGELDAIARDDGPVATRTHALLEVPRPQAWSIVADADALGRGGTNAIDDVRAVLGGDVGAIAPVPAVQLRSGMVAWASPRQVWIIDPQVRDDVARIDTCGEGVDAVAQAGDRLVVAACGRVTGVGADGRVGWRTAQVRSDDQRTILLPAPDAVVVARIGTRSLQQLRADDGGRAWSVQVDAPLRAATTVGADAVAYVARDADATWVGVVDVADGSLLWERRWRGWRETAIASDGRRVVLGIVDSSASSCQRSGAVDLDARTGASNATRRLDARVQVGGLGADAATSRMVALITGRSCSIERVTPRIDVLRARGLDRVRQAAVPSRPCSNLAVRGRLALVATCDEVIAVDTLTGRRRWSMPLGELSTRGSMALSTSGARVFMTDDVGTLWVAQPPRASGTS